MSDPVFDVYVKIFEAKSEQKYTDWTKIPWDGNHDLGYEVYRKSFGKGHVSVGVGDFHHIVYSYGPNSQSSLSGTRHRSGETISPEQAMSMVDRNYGRYNPLDNNP